MRPRDDTPRPTGNRQGARQAGDDTSIADPRATEVHTLAHDLAERGDWADRVAALGLPAAEARALRVAILRERTFGAAERYRPRRPRC